MRIDHTRGRVVRLGLAALIGWAWALAGVFVLSHAGREAGHWGATDIQLQNLANAPNVITVTLWKWDGTLLGSHTYTLTAGSTTYVTPGFGGSPTGTLVIDGRGEFAGAIAHLESPGEIGNEVYEINEEARWSRDVRLPLLERDLAPPGSSTNIVVHAPLSGNLSLAQEMVTATLTLFMSPGTITSTVVIPPNGAAQFNLAQETRLPAQWRGAGVVHATRPVLVEVKRDNGQTYDAYLSAQETGTELVLPWVKPSAPDVQSTVAVFNPAAITATVQMQFGIEPAFTSDLGPFSASVFVAPSGPTNPMPVRIFSLNNVSVAALTRMVSQAAGFEGTLSYAAFAVDDLEEKAVVPLLYGNYLGWSHEMPGAVQLYNAGTQTATVRLTYRSAEPGGVSIPYTATLAPYGTFSIPPPAGTAEHWSLFASSTRKLAVVTIGYRQGQTIDHWFAYRSRPFVMPPAERLFLPVMLMNAVWP